MKQYHKHLEDILQNGTRKEPAREGMPGSISLFGYQNKYNLQEGFPILTTKKVNFKNIVVELLWFLKGDTNIKYLVDNGCNIWNEDSYNYYLKVTNNHNIVPMSFKNFIQKIKSGEDSIVKYYDTSTPYSLGDCGKQYGWLWRNWGIQGVNDNNPGAEIDQIKNLIEGLKNNPMSRRHIITAWNPATLDDMALNACHSFVQFNVRPIYHKYNPKVIANYYLDCQLYQRSADMFLG